MWTLYHHWLSGPSRRVRLALAEKGIPVAHEIVIPWQRPEELLALNPACEVPVLVTDMADMPPISGAYAICEFLEEIEPDPGLLGVTYDTRAEVRRLVDWFEVKFAREVVGNLTGERLMKRLTGIGTPDSRAIKAGRFNLPLHLDYLTWLSDRRNWLVGRDLTLADLAAAAQLSVLDYAGDIPWDDHPAARTWYARIKSRPSFRDLLRDQVPGHPPSAHYADLDF